VHAIRGVAFETEGIAATIDVVVGVMARLQDQANESGINGEFPDMPMSLLKRAVAAGFGGHDSVVAIKILRGGDKN
jgi:hypothetical protein